ncbi:MAG: tRNA (guanosine(37)-N1)-methyltransferase TrmD [bacterium]
MIRFDIITIFPAIFKSFMEESLISRGQKKRLIKITVHDLRKWAAGQHKTVDDRPFGGGLGMVMKVEPIFKAVKAVKKGKSRVILFSPRGKKFDQKMAYRLSKYKQIVFICGRYEGVDERVAKYIANEEVSLGDYVLMGGEVATMAVIETVSRLIPGIIGKPQILKERITKAKGFIEYAEYTRPEVFIPKKGKSWRVPKVLLSGNQKEITVWKEKHGKEIGKQ